MTTMHTIKSLRLTKTVLNAVSVYSEAENISVQEAYDRACYWFIEKRHTREISEYSYLASPNSPPLHSIRISTETLKSIDSLASIDDYPVNRAVYSAIVLFLLHKKLIT